MDSNKFQHLIVISILHLMNVLYVAAYDPLDPHGSISIKWDVMSWTPDGYVAAVRMSNNQMYRHIASPGWTLGWTWAKKEVIWSMVGAQTTDQGDCSKFKGNIPHCCKKNPTVVDLLPGAPYNQRYTDCCKGGVLASLGQDPKDSASSFQLSVGLSGNSNTSIKLPKKFYLLGPGSGYTCSSPASFSEPSVFFSADGRRKTQAMMTWIVTCSYSQTLVSKNPTCCVSLSSFYNPMITPCPSCACGCRKSASESNCVMGGPRIASVVETTSTPMLECTQHMCPIRVHWHIKANYRKHWRVKITVTNFSYRMNYTQWIVVVQHPNLNNVTQVYNSVYKPLNLYNSLNDSGMFYGIKYFNDLLLEAGADGHAQTEMLLGKDGNRFTLEQGWGFPSRVYFNGDECKMPTPDSYPSLPSSAQLPYSSPLPTFLAFMLLLVSW